MQGPSEFTIKGVLQFWSGIGRLRKYAQKLPPFLVMNGQYDTVTESAGREILSSLAGAAKGADPRRYRAGDIYVTVPRAAHGKVLDNPRFVVAETKRFLAEL